MYYQVRGRGRPLLLLHAGFSTIETSFGALRDRLMRGRRTIALEQQGHGRTADISRPMAYAQMVEDTAQALESLEVAAADVVGWSDGGIVALGLAARHPTRVRRVAIMGAGYRPDAEPPEFRERMKNLDPANEHLAPFRTAYQAIAPDPAGWAGLVGKVSAMYLSFEGWPAEAMRRLAAPLLVMAGDRDFVRLEHAIELYRLVPNGQLAIVPGGDHGMPVTRGELVGKILEDFLNEKVAGET
jgi:pimeloyl-ACP methyl ester carboxylesterase